MLKIAKPSIDGLGNGDDDEVVPRAIVELGHRLRLDVVAEGIEHSQQLERPDGSATSPRHDRAGRRTRLLDAAVMPAWLLPRAESGGLGDIAAWATKQQRPAAGACSPP